MRHTLPEQLLWTLKLPWLQALLAWPICATLLRRLVQLSFFQCSFDVFAFIADCLGPGMVTEGMSESVVAVMQLPPLLCSTRRRGTSSTRRRHEFHSAPRYELRSGATGGRRRAVYLVAAALTSVARPRAVTI